VETFRKYTFSKVNGVKIAVTVVIEYGSEAYILENH
jgi:hypothetical protein